MDAGFGGGDGAIADHGAIRHPHLARQDHAIAEAGAAGDAHLGRQGTAPAGDHAMADVNKIVDLGAGADAGFAHGRAIEGAAAAHLHAVLEHHQAGLGHLAPAAGGGYEAKALRADHGPGVHNAIAAESAAGVQHGVGMQLAARLHDHVPIQHHGRMQDAVIADAAASPHHHMGPEVDVAAKPGRGMDHGRGVDPRFGTHPGIESLKRLGEAQARIVQRHPGEIALGGLLLQRCRIFTSGWDQDGGSPTGGQRCGQGVAFLQKTELGRTGCIKGLGAAQVRIITQVSGGGVAHLAEEAEQAAETHSPVSRSGRIVGPALSRW